MDSFKKIYYYMVLVCLLILLCDYQRTKREKNLEWWDWQDSNLRPRPYQGRTLTT
jgi:hypothetical protein